jgi:hypothetical protein
MYSLGRRRSAEAEAELNVGHGDVFIFLRFIEQE